MSENSRNVLDAIWPKGAFWEPASDDDYDKLLDGIAENTQYVKDDLSDLSSLRDPLKTPILDDLEEEYGIVSQFQATEDERRQTLKGFMFNRNISGAYDQLQDKLQEAGYDVIVIPNSPPIDPRIYYDPVVNVQGELIVNYLERNTLYDVPADPGYWPLFFFIGSGVTRDEYGNIIEIEYIDIPDGRRFAMKQLILNYKPLHSWGVLVEVRTQFLDGTRWLDGTWWLNGFGREVT
jgi:hypothetical protein